MHHPNWLIPAAAALCACCPACHDATPAPTARRACGSAWEAGRDSAVNPPATTLQRGARAFRAGGCETCHGKRATGGLYGPNLTDGEWLHCDGTPEGILGLLRSGVPPDKVCSSSAPLGMPPAGKRIARDADLIILAHYVHSLRRAGTPEPHGRNPEGSTGP
jgi:mono/diheme cytochrome c family protein